MLLGCRVAYSASKGQVAKVIIAPELLPLGNDFTRTACYVLSAPEVAENNKARKRLAGSIAEGGRSVWDSGGCDKVSVEWEGKLEGERVIAASSAASSAANLAASSAARSAASSAASSADVQQVCAGCGKAGFVTGANKLRVCRICKAVFYCSKKCQTEDWRRHKRECKKAGKGSGKNPGKGSGKGRGKGSEGKGSRNGSGPSKVERRLILQEEGAGWGEVLAPFLPGWRVGGLLACVVVSVGCCAMWRASSRSRILAV